MRLHIVSSTKDKTISGNVAWGDGAVIDLGSKPTDKFMDALLASNNPKVGLLPPAVRWISNDKRMVVFERPPGYQRLSFYEVERAMVSSTDSKYLQEYVLPMPWTVYVMGFGFDYQPVTVRVYLRKESLSSLDDPVFLMPLMNFYTNSKLCNPIFGKYEEHEHSIATGIHLAYNSVWNSGFNFDLVDALKMGVGAGSPFKFKADPTYGPGWAGSYRTFFAKWQKKTIEDMLDATLLNPSIADNGSENGTVISLRNGINAVHMELKASATALSKSKEFITALVNNFSSV